MVNVPLANSEEQSKFMKNSKKFHKHSKSTSRSHFPPSDEVSTSTIDTRSGDTSTTLLVETAPPAIAIVAPTARNPSNIVNNHLKQPCKAHGQSSIGPRIINLQPIHHIQQVPINTTQQPPPQVAAWVEPAFNFGPGFLEIPQFCPTHSRPQENQHVVFFHLSPGIAASFQIAGIQKIFQGESRSAFFILFYITMIRIGFNCNIATSIVSARDYPLNGPNRKL